MVADAEESTNKNVRIEKLLYFVPFLSFSTSFIFMFSLEFFFFLHHSIGTEKINSRPSTISTTNEKKIITLSWVQMCENRCLEYFYSLDGIPQANTHTRKNRSVSVGVDCVWIKRYHFPIDLFSGVSNDDVDE